MRVNLCPELVKVAKKPRDLGFFRSTNGELAPDWHRGYFSTFSIASAARVSVLWNRCA